MTEVVANPEQKTEEKAPKTVPLTDLLAVKSRLSKLTEELESLKSERDTAKRELGLFEAELSNPSDTDDTVAVKKKLLGKHRELDRREAELRDRETKIEKALRKSRAQELAAAHGVDADVLLSVEDMEKEALRLENERLSKDRQSAAEKQPSNRVYERGAPPLSQKMVQQMSDKEFGEYLERQKREAALRR